jgi:hypothetical protein
VAAEVQPRHRVRYRVVHPPGPIHEGYQANWFCYLASHATEHAAELDRQLLQRLLALPGNLWLDVSGDDS